MLFRRLRSRRDPLKHLHPAKRIRLDDGTVLRRYKIKKPKPPKRRRSLFERIAYPTVFVLIALYFAFNGTWSFYRLGGAVYDLLLSVAEYLLCVMHLDAGSLPIRINDVPDVPYVPFLPIDPSELEGLWSRFFSLLFHKEHFLAYFVQVVILAMYLSQLALPVLLLCLVGTILIRGSVTDENDDFEKCTRSVRFLRWLGRGLSPILLIVRELWYRASLSYLVWLSLLFFAGTNLLTVGLEAVALLLHLSVSADYKSLYLQLYKLALDLTVAFDALPLLVWLVIGYVLSVKIRQYLAYKRLDTFEEAVRDVVSRLPLLVLLTGKVGVGKTQTNVNLTLSFQDAHRDRQKESMLEIRAEFPDYPWALLDQQIGIMYFMGDLKGKAYTRSLFTSLLREDDALFYGYVGRRKFTDGVTVSHLRDRIVDYAELQYMYRVQCTVFSSYSLRVDAKYVDKGKFPAWTSDYFRSAPFDPRGEAERAHVSDFDLLRLGKTVDPASPAGAWEFGIWSHTEMGKDYGNSLTNKDLKESAPTSNVKNDLIVDRLKIKRHSSTACYTPYAQYIGDEQRPSSLQADVLELTNVLCIKGSSGPRSTYHLFLIERFLRDLLLSLWHGFYADRSVNRADVDLPTFALMRLMDRFYPSIRRQQQLFGFELLDVHLKDGEDMDAEPELLKLPVAYKKVRAGRYGTDCYADVLAERAAKFNPKIYSKLVEGEDLTKEEKDEYESWWEHDTSRTYSGPVASPDEIKAQHSRFGDKLLKINNRRDISND